MTDQERNQILKMIEDGKITPEEGLRLMQTLEQNPAEDETQAAEAEAGPASRPEAGAEKSAKEAAEGSSLEADPKIARIKDIVRRLWLIPLALGVGVTILGGWIMYANMHPASISGWFYCLGLPVLLLGVAVIAAAVGARKARWLFVDVHQKPGEKPQHIFLGFPLPLKFTAWFLRHFGHKIPDLEKTNVDDIIQVVETGFSDDEPLIVNVDEGEGGERVQVYIG
ncbi:MAG: hypothetical protein KJ606_11210 [Chloroflexi bacterium]|nr:hypothetical protein [Chloroflexota bacterium]